MSISGPALDARLLVIGMGEPTDQPGGLNRYARAYCDALALSGLRSLRVMVASDSTALPQGWLRGSRRSVHPITRTLRMNIAGAAAARRADVIDCHFAQYSVLPVLTARLLRKPVLAHWHGPWAAEGTALRSKKSRARTALKSRVERFVYSRARVVVVLSASFHRLLCETHRIDPARVIQMPPGVDTRLFSPTVLPPQGAARCSAVAVRRLVPRMGLDVLINAWPHVVRELPDAQLTIVGDGPERSSLEQLASSLCPQESVKFTGAISDSAVRNAYADAAVSVVPSRQLEGFGLVVLESLACGTPVVATDVGGLRDALAGLQADLLVPPESVEALAQRLIDGFRGERPFPARDECAAYAQAFSWATLADRTVGLVGSWSHR